MLTFLIVLIILASVLLGFFVLIQNPKGGGLVSGFAGGTNIMGVKRTGDFLEKSTWVLIIVIIACSLMVNILPAQTGSTGSSGRAGDIEAAPMSTPLQDFQQESPSSMETPAVTPETSSQDTSQ